MTNDIEHKKMILERIVGSYSAEGPLPPIQELNSCISQMDPKELAQAIYLLEYNDHRTNMRDAASSFDTKLRTRVYFSQGVKNDIEKIFMAVVEHFRRMPGEVSPVVDQIFHYFYQALIHLATKQGLISYN